MKSFLFIISGGLCIFFTFSLLSVRASASPPSCTILSSPVALRPGTIHPNVLYLQKLLNLDPATQIAPSGPGSPGQETTRFGPRTTQAVKRLQAKYTADILTPAHLTTPTGFVGPATRKKLLSLYCTSSSPSSPATTTPPTPLPPDPSGATGAITLDTPCTIDQGYNSCLATLSWTTTKATTPTLTKAATAIAHTPAGSLSLSLSYGPTTFTLLNGSSTLDTKTITPSCLEGTSWNGTACVAEVVVPPDPIAKDCTNCFKKRYIYYSGNFVRANLTRDASYAKLVELIDRGKAAGYNGIMVNAGGSGDYASMVRGSVHTDYYTNFADLVARAKAANMEIIPVALTPQSMTGIDPTSTEAIPVKSRPFIVSSGAALSKGTEITTNTSFESGATGWNLLDTGITVDSTTAHTGTASIKIDAGSGKPMIRLYREFTGLQPFTAYRMSFWVKTNEFDAPLWIQIYDGKTKNLVYGAAGGIGVGTKPDGEWEYGANAFSPTQDWKEYNLDFNTFNNSTVRLYFGIWANPTLKGYAHIDDIHIKEIGLSHVIRRASYPIIVTSADNTTTYTEGTDYVVGVEKLTIPPPSRITNGSTINVSWGQSGKGFADVWYAPASACYQSFFDNSKAVASKTNNLLNFPKGFFVYYDEWRVMNWDPACGGITAGQYLANTMRKIEKALYEINPNFEIYVWNDMFDPYHNATTSYYMVNGDVSGSWDGLGSKTIIMNWYHGNSANQINSLKFFSGKGMRQMLALYYDDTTLAQTDAWLKSLDEAEKQGVTGVDGFMYTTWYGDANYGDLERVAEYIKTKYPSRWPK